VPIGYLETVGPVALFTLAVLWPPRRPAGPARVVFVLTHLLNEAPVIGWIWLLTSTALAVTGRQLASAGGAAVAALAVFTAAGLIEVTRRGLRTSRAVEDALNRALGPARAPANRPSQRQHLLRATREVLLPLPWRPRRVRRIRNLRYGPHGRHNLLDLYLCRDQHAAPRPVLIHFHGGHFEVGAKSREALPLLHRFAAQGWLCISANYRLGSAGRFPNALIDAKQVITWARSPAAAAYRADPATLIVAGSSAGAHLAAMAALTINDPNYQPGFEHDDTTVTGAVCLYGYYGDLDTGGPLPSTPQAHVRRDAPPFMIIHGTNDTLVPLPDAATFADQLARTSASPVVYLTLPAALHSFDLLHSPRFDNVIDGIDTFTAAVRAAASATTRAK
jgi:acetyl esterase/lipase